MGDRNAVGSFTKEAAIARFGGLAVFDRALSDAEMQRMHDLGNIGALNAAVDVSASTSTSDSASDDVFDIRSNSRRVRHR